MQSSFDSIRPYNNKEIKEIYRQIAENRQIIDIASKVVPQKEINHFLEHHDEINTTYEFQKRYMYPMLNNLMQVKDTKITFSGIDNICSPCVFLSNHRDIVVDPAFLQYVLVKNNLNTSEIAIGDNLLASKWIITSMRINKGFLVKRGMSRGEQVAVFVELSNYINHVISEKKETLWIAQRQGRAKDSNDRTQASLIKMLALSGDGNFIDNIKRLNITPLSISYEYDSCDFLKVKEMHCLRDDQNFVKSQEDDILSMSTGALGHNSEIHYAFAPCINQDLDKIALENCCKKEEVEKVVALIDNAIHGAYKLYTSNYVAYDMLFDRNIFEKFYSLEKKVNFAEYIEKQISKIDIKDLDRDFCRTKLLQMYSNPLINKLKMQIQ